MISKWFDANDAAKIGAALADEFLSQLSEAERENGLFSTQSDEAIQQILNRSDDKIRHLSLNLYKKAKFANSFKWRLLENGVEKAVAGEVTQRLVLHLSDSQAKASAGTAKTTAKGPPKNRNAKNLLAQAKEAMAGRQFSEAIALYKELIRLNPRHTVAINNLAAALCNLGLYKEAEAQFNEAIRVKSDHPDAYSNLGNMLLMKGEYSGAENSLRHALKLNPRFADARINLGLTLAHLGRLSEAKSQIHKALKYEPGNVDALVGMAYISKMEGRFEQADTMIGRALRASPKLPKALASRSGLRKMSSADSAWLEITEEVADSGLAPADESELRFAIGKYYDDVQDYKLAFQNYQRANDLLKPIAEPYDRGRYERFVATMMRIYAPEVITRERAAASASMKPVFVVGMPRSGTSLTEQIIASHPSAKGAGELQFWSHAIQQHEAAIKDGPLSRSIRDKLADGYLRALENRTGDALRIVDKTPINTDYLGVIHSVLPNARIIYMQRDPIDTCLSCYQQKFTLSLNFTLDLSDLAHYYREHTRLMSHWRAVLPPGSILDVPYEGLVADQERWSRKIFDFLDLKWNDRVLRFHETERDVATASFWQVRQPLYQSSVRRWRNYKKFIGPLLDLKQSA
jgi:tetratricopeptide (TPR) repeat protein